MGFVITSNGYVDYLEMVSKKIAENKEYISELDADTGDGDHWANINMGFKNILSLSDELREQKMDRVFFRIGTIMMSKIGGSSGVLYGGAYMAAGKEIEGKKEIDSEDMCRCLRAMCIDMCKRGKSEPGYKTMIDALYPAVEMYEKCLIEGTDEKTCMERVKKASLDGAKATADMSARRGRASYRADKGVGHLDPGAVTMSYQISCLCDYILEKLL